MALYFIVSFTITNSDDTIMYDFKILQNKEPMNLFEKYDSIEIFTPADLHIHVDVCKKIQELESEVNNFYFAHPYRLDDYQQNKIDQMELNLQEFKKLILDKIENA
jgi:hypothetical protein